MTDSTERRGRLAANVLFLHTGLLLVAFFVLATVFEFPEVLRQPPERILELFRANRSWVRPAYYLFTLTGVTFIAMAFVLHEALVERTGSWNRLALLAGTLAGLAQALGFIRWVWLVPELADVVFDPSASEGERGAARMLFQGMHQFAGVSVGENLAFLFQGVWTFAAAGALAFHGGFDRRLARAGFGSGATFVLYSLEQFGGPLAWLGHWNTVFHIAWLAWLLLLALLLRKAAARRGRTGAQGPVLVDRSSLAKAGSLAVALLVATEWEF